METKKLTCCDLMIGDYVIFDPNVFNNNEDEYEPTKEPYPCRIESGEQIDKAVNGCYSPIPLTAEVLEKSGFYKQYDGDIIAYTHLIYDNIIIEMGMNYKLFDDGRFYVRGIKQRFYFVHQLQHALRLCRVDKEIVL